MRVPEGQAETTGLFVRGSRVSLSQRKSGASIIAPSKAAWASPLQEQKRTIKDRGDDIRGFSTREPK